MKKTFLNVLGRELRNEAPAELKWMPGMVLRNSNGDVDPTAVGYDYAIRTTTFLRQQTIAQKFFKVAPADFFTIEVGQGAWMENITQNLSFDVAGDFESGIMRVGASTELSEVDVALSPKTVPIVTWAKGYRYSVPEIEKALAANNWDVVKAKTDALKRNWDLGIQAIAFLGSKANSSILGLLTQSDVTVDTTTLTQNIKDMDVNDFQTFVSNLLNLYYANTNYTQLPNTFVIPMDDFLGLGVATSAQFTIISKLEFLLKTFREMTGNPKFQIKGLPYAMKANNIGRVSTLGSQRYALYNNEAETLRMDIPVDFNLTSPGTKNNFYWEGVGYGQYTGVNVYRPREVYYLDHSTN